MEKSIVVNEKYSSNWKTTFYSSLAVAAVGFTLYLNLNDVLWAGILRLTAFISFSLSIFCLLKMMEGRKTFQMDIKDGSLHIIYLKNDKVVHEEMLSKDNIQSIYKAPSFYKLPVTNQKFYFSNTYHFKVQFIDSDHDINLLKFGGRALSVDKKTGMRLEQFLEAHKFYTNS